MNTFSYRFYIQRGSTVKGLIWILDSRYPGLKERFKRKSKVVLDTRPKSKTSFLVLADNAEKIDDSKE